MKKAPHAMRGEGAGQKPVTAHIERPALTPQVHYIPPLRHELWRDLADVIVDRAALHIRARVPGCPHFTLDELTTLLSDFRAEVEQLVSLVRDDEEED
jgi:hypothetical protein